MKARFILFMVFLIAGVNALAQHLDGASVSFSGTSKATEVDPRFRQHVITWMSNEVKRKTGCELTAIVASSAPYVESWIGGSKPEDAPERMVEIWNVEYCEKHVEMLVRFDFSNGNVIFNAEQIRPATEK